MIADGVRTSENTSVRGERSASIFGRSVPFHSLGLTRTDQAGSWSETMFLVSVGAALLLLLIQPAFHAFFIAENFEYLGQYRTNGSDFWQAITSPTNRIFFRPVFFASSLPWYSILPLDPWAYHFRNFAFTVVNLLLLHRVMVHLGLPRFARVMALLLFAISKVHMTTVGYLNIFDSTIMLMLLLSTLLFFLRYIAHTRTIDYIFAMLCCSVSIFTKDYGLVIVAVVIALAVSQTRADQTTLREAAKWWGIRLAPLAAIILLYLGARYAVVGLLPSSDAIYSPQLDVSTIVLKVLIFLSALGNLSFTPNGVTGSSVLGHWIRLDTGELGPWLASTLGGAGLWMSLGDILLYVALTVLICVTIAYGLSTRWRVLFPLVWIAAYAGPTVLTRNQQIYYVYEALAGFAVLLALCLQTAPSRLRLVWGGALVVIGINAAASNYASPNAYTWQYVSNASAKAKQPVIEQYRGQPVETISFITKDRPFWFFALGNASYPLLPELMRTRNLQVTYVNPRDAEVHANQAGPRHLVFDVDNGFIVYPSPLQEGERSSGRTEARLSAAPNPVPLSAEPATTRISWDTGDGSVGQVYVSATTGAEQLFAQGPSGTAEAPWILPGLTYTFRLYSGSGGGSLLAEVHVETERADLEIPSVDSFLDDDELAEP
jgi:hypothetical protein